MRTLMSIKSKTFLLGSTWYLHLQNIAYVISDKLQAAISISVFFRHYQLKVMVTLKEKLHNC